MLKPILIAVFISVVILGECAVAYLLIPSTSDLEGWAKKKQAEHATADEHATPGEHGQEGKEEHQNEHSAEHDAEVELGKFNVIVHKPVENLTMRINFHLIGTVPEKEHLEFEELYTKCEHRLRDQIIFEIRKSDVADLSDPGLALLKRKILAKSNELLGKPMLRTIVFSDFAFIEQ
ncbi:MAG: flagellar basal body-associated FliL family protein [Pirellulaceae bacterium]